MEFEFDPEKSATNKAKHGLDFTEAQLLWSDPFLVEVPAQTEDEVRFLVIGRVGVKHWTAIFAWRLAHPNHLGAPGTIQRGGVL